jgi:hypothetical protein
MRPDLSTRRRPDALGSRLEVLLGLVGAVGTLGDELARARPAFEALRAALYTGEAVVWSLVFHPPRGARA